MQEPDRLSDRRDLVARMAVIGAGLGGIVGGIVGLVVGVIVYAPTAWFAVIELGAPVAVVGGVGGLITGLMMKAAHRGGSS